MQSNFTTIAKTNRRKPVFGCTVAEHEALELDKFANSHNMDRAKLVRNALEFYTKISLSDVRERSLAQEAVHLTPKEIDFIKRNIDKIDTKFLEANNINSREVAIALRINQ